MTHPVKWFSSDQGGHPVLGDTAAGDFIALLKACLITGYNTKPISALAFDSGTGKATATVGSVHGYLKHQVIEITGADQPEYNGQHRVTAIGSDWIEYAPATAPSVTPATGSLIEAKAAPVGGWEVVMEDATNHHLALRSTAPDATPHTFMITNDGDSGSSGTNGNFAGVRILEAFTDFSTFEEATFHAWAVSHRYASEEWLLVADDKMIYWINRYASPNKAAVFALGDIESVRPGDAAHCLAIGCGTGTAAEWDTSYDSPYTNFLSLGSTSYREIARAYHQLPGNVAWHLAGIGSRIGGTLNYPNPANNAFYCATGKLMVIESGGLRGFMPGLLQPLQTSIVYHKAVVDNLPDLEGIPVIFWIANASINADGDERLVGWRLDQWRPEVGA